MTALARPPARNSRFSDYPQSRTALWVMTRSLVVVAASDEGEGEGERGERHELEVEGGVEIVPGD